MKKLTIVAALASVLTAGSAFAVDISHSVSYGNTEVFGTATTSSTSFTNTDTFKFTEDQDAGRNNAAPGSVYTPDHNGKPTLIKLPEAAGVDNIASGTDYSHSHTTSTTQDDMTGEFSSVTVFNEASISANGLTAGEGFRDTRFTQNMTGSTVTDGMTELTSVSFADSTNGVDENGSVFTVTDTTTFFNSTVDNKHVNTTKNTITDYSFIK